MKIIEDIHRFLSVLSFIDIIFFIAILVLLILIVTLVYFIKINKDVLDEDDFFPPNDSKKDDENKKENDVVKEITDNIEGKKEVEEYNDEEGELLDLESLTKKLKEKKDNEQVSINEYEQEQEEKAIISYDELLQKHNRYSINYEKEEVLDDLVVRKVNLNNLINEEEKEERQQVRVISYQKEEAFLSALKELNKLLN